MLERTYKCARCGKESPWIPDPLRASTLPEHFPFCSERCRLIDLGKWIEGEYQISDPLPQEPPPDDEDAQ